MAIPPPTPSTPADASDGLHLTSEGYAVFWEEYTKLVKTVFACLRELSSLRTTADSRWDSVDASNPDILAAMRLPPIRTAQS
jgi:hypothetical protein